MTQQRDGSKAAARLGRSAAVLDLRGRLALRPVEAAEALGISERRLRSLLPQLPHVREGGVVLLPVEGLRRWLEERAKVGDDHANSVARQMLEDLSA